MGRTDLDVARAPRRGRPPGSRTDRHRRSRSPVARRCSAGQHPGHAHRNGRGRARRVRRLRHQQHPPRRRAGARHRARRLPDPAHRPRARRPARRAGVAWRAGAARGRPGLGGPDRSREGRTETTPRGRGHRHVHADLHLRDQRRPESRQGHARDGAARRRGAGRPLRIGPRRRLLPVDAAVPFQRSAGGVVGGPECRRVDGPRPVHRVAVHRRRARLRRHLPELRGKTAGLHPRQPRAARRPRQPPPRRVRKRGQRPRHRRIRPTLRLHGLGWLRLDRERGHSHARGRMPARFHRQGLPRGGDLRPRHRVRMRRRPIRCARPTDQPRRGHR